MTEFSRKRELSLLLEYRDNGKIKVVTGLRRCGKTYLLTVLFRRALSPIGIKENEIQELNLLGKDFAIRTSVDLYNAMNASVSQGTKILIIDEVQLAGEDFHRPVLAFHEGHPRVDLYLTGSNSKLLSKDVLKKFKDRSVEISVSPLTLSEIREEIPDYQFDQYLRFGGIPLVVNCSSEREKEDELRRLWENVYASDIDDQFSGNRISSSARKDIIRHVLSCLTSPTSETKIAKRLVSRMQLSSKEMRVIKTQVMDLLNFARDSFLLVSFEQKPLPSDKTSPEASAIEKPLKNYCADLGLLRVISESKSIDADALENAVFLHLRSMGLHPYGEEVAKADGAKGEVDFVYTSEGKRHLIQVAFLLNESNVDREISYLLERTGTDEVAVVCYENRAKDLTKGVRVYVGDEFFVR